MTTPDHRKSLEDVLYFGNFDSKFTEYEMIKLISPIAKIKRLKYLWHHYGDNKNLPRGYAFVTFESKEDAEKVRKSLNGCKIDGKRLAVDHAFEHSEDYDQSESKGKASGSSSKSKSISRAHGYSGGGHGASSSRSSKGSKESNSSTVKAAGGHYAAAIRDAEGSTFNPRREAAAIVAKLREMQRKGKK